jgi:hypothetical protein
MKIRSRTTRERTGEEKNKRRTENKKFLFKCEK